MNKSTNIKLEEPLQKLIQAPQTENESVNRDNQSVAKNTIFNSDTFRNIHDQTLSKRSRESKAQSDLNKSVKKVQKVTKTPIFQKEEPLNK